MHGQKDGKSIRLLGQSTLKCPTVLELANNHRTAVLKMQFNEITFVNNCGQYEI